MGTSFKQRYHINTAQNAQPLTSTISVVIPSSNWGIIIIGSPLGDLSSSLVWVSWHLSSVCWFFRCWASSIACWFTSVLCWSLLHWSSLLWRHTSWGSNGLLDTEVSRLVVAVLSLSSSGLKSNLVV